MSGIAGCFYYTSQQSGLLGKKIHKMLKNLNAGERQETEFFTNNENVTFGFSNSNSVNAASMYADNDYVVCFSGHLTNNKDLALLTGLSCDGSGKSAARIISKLFKEKKDEIVYSLQGIYACIILGKEKKSLWILTDRSGFEFLYYYRDNKSFIFATEIRPILSVLDSPPEADFRSICEIYSFNTVFNAGTPFKNIKLMPHAAVCSVNPENTTISQYWDYPIEVEHHDEDEEALLEKSKQLIQSAVDNALCGYDNIGVMLSGGLDSRFLASVAARNTDRVKAFTFEFGEEETKDILIAERIANQLNLEFYNVAPKIVHPIDEIEKCILDTDGQWAFLDLLPYIRKIGQSYPGIALINGFLMDTLFKSGWAFFPGKFHGNLKKAIERRYCAIGDYLVDKLFNPEIAKFIKETKTKSVHETLGDLQLEKQVEVSLRFYCINRGRRSLNPSFKAFKKYLNIGLPGTDYQLMDFAFRLPYRLRSNPNFYLKLICTWFPEIAKIPWDRTGKPLTKGMASKNKTLEEFLFKSKYYIQRITKGRVDFLNSKSGFNWKFRNDKRFQESIKEILFDQRTLSRGFFNQRAIELLVKEHLAGKDYATLFKEVISIEMLHRKFIDFDTRDY